MKTNHDTTVEPRKSVEQCRGVSRLWARDGTWRKILAEVIVNDESVGATHAVQLIIAAIVLGLP